MSNFPTSMDLLWPAFASFTTPQNHGKMKIDCESERRWSASRLVNEVKSLARGLLLNSGMKKGDVVAFYCPNSDHHSIALLAVSCIGAIYTGSGDYFPFRKC